MKRAEMDGHVVQLNAIRLVRFDILLELCKIHTVAGTWLVNAIFYVVFASSRNSILMIFVRKLLRNSSGI